ncbi:MAG: trypsin-like peptidase domain-containing protein [Chroococcidiopsidaceae cyanobacterium CP_BM_ER_R8_30]|nr:trypsin-like peptidase domain-containing protein [Chroococcidiopsidaceae cyanobacterium CP_BM_ER_R8_30]
MSSFPSERTSALLALSNDLAATVEQAGQCVVAVKARSRISSSGVHWRKDIVVAADETIRRSEDITVTLSDGRTVSVTLAGRDPSTDIAVLKLPDLDLPVAQLGEATSLKVGHLVLAVGRSDEGSLNASLGTVSALGSAWHSSYGGLIDQFVRLDLTLYPNIEGGPLVDAAGQVVGIAVSGPRRTVLAIPTATVNRVVNQLLEKGRIARGYLGLGMQPVRLPERLKQTLNLPSLGGVIVVNVEPNGPAEQAGVTIGDVIVALDNTPVSDTRDVQAMLSPDRVGKTISVRMIRGGTVVELDMTVGERPRWEE